MSNKIKRKNIKILSAINLRRISSIICALLFLVFVSSCEFEPILVKVYIPELMYEENNVFLKDEFKLENYEIVLSYDNYLVERLPLSKDMLKEGDFEKLNTPGTHSITVLYEDFSIVLTITIVENTTLGLSKLTIFELNDTHGHIEKNNNKGFSNVAYYVNQERNKNDLDDVVLIANGDMFQGTAISNLTEGRAVIDTMNKMDFDMLGIGNHEFDWGLNKILNYFDGNNENGEANFPLLNANIYERSSNKLVQIDGGNIFESIIVEKEGIKVGLVSFMDNLESSINATMIAPYIIKTDYTERAKRICTELKEKGADVIIVNIHGGNSSGVEKFYLNNAFANITYNGEYLVDAIINGHTHTRQKGYIERYDGLHVPVVQSSGNTQSIGKIELILDEYTNDVTSVNVSNVDVSSSYYDESVEAVVKEYQNLIGETSFCEAGETVDNKKVLGRWSTAVMRTAMDTDVAIMNTAGVRSAGYISKGQTVTINHIYEIFPFNNKIYLTKVKGSDLYKLLNNSGYYYYDSKVELKENDDNYYTVAVVDYVFTGGYFVPNKDAILTDIGMTDLLIEELKLLEKFTPSDLSNIKTGKKYEYE